MILGGIIISLGLGFLGGYMIWGTSSNTGVIATHVMPDGSVMTNTGTVMDMGQTMASMTLGLAGKTGDAFDKEFLAEMIVHHEGAVDMAKLVLINSKRPELIKLAHNIISAQTGEISMMKQWESEWFK